MWAASEEPPGTMEGGPPETCEQTKSQLETFKEIMDRNKQNLRKKEEEAQEYAKKLSKFKSRAKYSRKSKDGAASLGEAGAKPSSESVSVEDVEESGQKSSLAKSSLLQRKLAEDREMFERRSKEMTESKRAVEEKVEAIKQQLDENTTAMLESPLYQSSVNQTMVTSPHLAHLQEKENKIVLLNNRVLELEALVLDLQENLKEKDSVIESKMQAVTLMSADLSKKGKTTLDTLEDTKDEMRNMQEHFVLVESSLRDKNNSLLEQLKERDQTILDMENSVKELEERLETQKLAESASADFSRSTMDTLVETKDAMKAMQENFVIVESSLKSKNEHLLQQLEERELRLAEAQAQILRMESDAGIFRPPQLEDLEYKINSLEENNRELQNEKYELQKNLVDLQNKLLANEPVFSEGIVLEKDNRIAELEGLVEELRRSNQLLVEESREELQSQIGDLTARNEEFATKIGELEQALNEMEAQKSAKVVESGSTAKEEDKDMVAKLTKELDELNKSMIKLKAQHKNQIKGLRRQLDNFRKVSDTNAELVKLGNQVALLEEEKGNLQLSLVDFDEIKASTGDLNTKIADLESKVAVQAKEIETHIEAIAQLENQKLDLTQELITAKQEISNLEAENAESENLRVTAEMKIVELEEQLETLNKCQLDNKQTEEIESLRKQVDVLLQENADLVQKLMKSDEKGSSDAGSTESFETIHETDKNELIKKIEFLMQKNLELENKLLKMDDKSTTDSTDSFENINDLDKSELIKRVNLLRRENGDLVMKLSRYEEKGSSDTGSTESFEKIPEHVETVSKVELLTRENNELVIKATKLEEKLNDLSLQITELDVRNQELMLENNQLKEKENIAASENVIADLEKQIEDYKTSIAEQKEAVEDLKQKLKDKEEELRLKSEIGTSEVDIHSLQVELRESYSSAEEWKFKYAGLEEKVQFLEAGKASIEQKLNLLQSEKVELIGLLEQKETALNEERMHVEKLVTDLEDHQQELASVAAQNSRKDQTIASLNDEIEQKNTELEDVTAKLKSQSDMMDKLQKELNELRNINEDDQALISSLKDQLMKSVSANEDKESFLKKSSEEYDELLQDLTNKNAAYNLLQMEMDKYKNEIEEYKAQLQALNQRNEEQHLIIEDLENRLFNVQGILDNNNLYIENLKEELEDVKKQMSAKFIEETENYNRKLDEVMSELQEKIAENKTLVQQLEEKDAALNHETKASLESRVSELEQEIQTKVEKMKKFAAKLKKKTLQYEELEHDIVGLKEQIQQSAAAIQEKDNKITELESQISSSSETINALNVQLTELQEKVNHMVQKIQEVGEEDIEGLIEKLHKQQTETEEAKEKARELGVRMQVMEAEYVDQLFDIQSLQAKNGLLLSKQEQITERLENAEKISEERRSLLEQIESERGLQISKKEESETQTTEEDMKNHCENCESCRTKIREMEAKLQERNAEIENLDNELATSIENFVQMQENLRFNLTRPGVNAREDLDNLTAQHNQLKTENQDLKKRISEALNRNEVLKDKLSILQQLSDAEREDLDRADQAMATELQSLRDNLTETEQLKTQYEEEIRSLKEEIEKLKSKEEKVEVKETEDTPMFDAFKAFDISPDNESTIKKLQSQINERDNQCMKLSEEIERLSQQISEERTLAEQSRTKFVDEIAELQSKLGEQLQRHLSPICGADRDEAEQLRSKLEERNTQLESLSSEIANFRDELSRISEEKLALSVQLENDKASFESQISELSSVKTELEMRLAELGTQHVALQEEIQSLQTTVSLMQQKDDDCNRLMNEKELEVTNLKEELLKYQKDFEDSKMRSQAVEEELNEVQQQKKALEDEVMNLKQNMAEKEQELLQKKESFSAEATVQPEETPTAEGWDEDNVEKLVLEEGWGWSSEQLPESSTNAPALPSSLESELMAKITNLECDIKNLEREKNVLADNNKALQIKCDKAMKKLMQKIKQEKMTQMHQQKSSSSLCDLDQTIIDELKSQIATLEKSLTEADQKQKELLDEKESLVKRIDVLVAANERYLEMKERQDMSVEVYEIRNKELTAKIEALEAQLGSVCVSSTEIQTSVEKSQTESQEVETSATPAPFVCEVEKYQQQINELKENINALADKNEELQHLLDKQENVNLELKSKLTSECTLKIDESEKKFEDLSTSYNKLQEEYDSLQQLYKTALNDENDKLDRLNKNSERLQEDLEYYRSKFESEMNTEKESIKQEINELNKNIQQNLQEQAAVVQELDNLNGMNSKFDSISSSLGNVSEMLKMREEEISLLKEELKQKCDERLIVERKLHETNEKLLMDINEKQIKLDEYLALINDRDRSLQSQTEEIKKLKETLDELEHLRKEDLAVLNEKNAEIEKHMQELKRLQEIVNERELIFSACQADVASKDHQLSEQKSQIAKCEIELKKYAEEVEKYSAEVHRLKDLLYEEASRRTMMLEEQMNLNVKLVGFEKCATDLEKCQEKENQEIDRLSETIRHDHLEIEQMILTMQSDSKNFNALVEQLSLKDQQINEMKQDLAEKNKMIDEINQSLLEKQSTIDKLMEQYNKETEDPLENIPVFTMTEDQDVEKLKAELIAKQVEIDNLTFALNKNTYPRILQDLQDTINKLYNDKAQLEMALNDCQEENEKLKNQLTALAQEAQSREEARHESIEKRLISNQDEILRLQNELHLKEQEINELKYVIGEKDAKLQASIEISPEDLESQQTIDMLNSQLYTKHQELEAAQIAYNQLRLEFDSIRQYQVLSEEYKAAIEALQTEKEQSVEEFEKKLAKILEDKDVEVAKITKEKEIEKEAILEEIGSLRKQLDECQEQTDEIMKELAHSRDDVAEKERRLAELSITKDTEIHSLKVLLHERDVRIEELHALSEEEDKQLSELKALLTERDEKIDELKLQLYDKVQELELVQSALQRYVAEKRELSDKEEASGSQDVDSTSSRLDMALYMLHQRDVRCEELTQELMQLLEERDTLQLRLSNAIRVNEELRRVTDTLPKKQESSEGLPLVENPSPSKSEGPVEIAKEAIHTPISLEEDHDALVQKLSQLHNVGHAKDVRLKDDRELRHNQQMSLLAHKDLSSLPPEAAARLVNANYTLSRDVQSQSSVLLNWLWGKSTPKVVHM